MVQGEDDITVYREQLPPRGDKLRSFCSMERLATAVAINPRIKGHISLRATLSHRLRGLNRCCVDRQRDAGSQRDHVTERGRHSSTPQRLTPKRSNE